jgi:hypothetical protein
LDTGHGQVPVKSKNKTDEYNAADGEVVI